MNDAYAPPQEDDMKRSVMLLPCYRGGLEESGTNTTATTHRKRQLSSPAQVILDCMSLHVRARGSRPGSTQEESFEGEVEDPGRQQTTGREEEYA